MRRLVWFVPLCWLGCQQAPPPQEIRPLPAALPVRAPEHVRPPEVLEPLPEPPRPLLATVAVDAQESGASRRIGELRQLVVVADLEGVTVATEVSLEFITPDGTPFEVQRAEAMAAPDDLQRFSFSLPVAGTLIDASALTGRWTARLLVAGVPLAEQTFELEP